MLVTTKRGLSFGSRLGWRTTSAERYASPARPSDPTPHGKPGSRHIPLSVGDPEIPEPPAPRTLHPTALGRPLREKQNPSVAVTGAKYRSHRRSRKHCPGATPPRPSIVQRRR